MCVCLVKAAGMLQGRQKQSADGQAQLDFSGKVKSCAKCVKKSLDLATISTQEALSFHFSFKTGYGSLGTRLGVTITLLSSAGFYYSNSVWERDHTKLKHIIYVSTLAEKGPAMARPAGPVPPPMCYYVSANQEIFTKGEW